MGYKLKNIYVVNESTVLSDATLTKYCLAIQKQVQQHFEPAWGISAYVKMVPKSAVSTIPQTSYNGIIYIIDTPDTKDPELQGVLGYHDYTLYGQPIGYVFAKTDIDNGLSPSVTLSHEILEMLGDVFCNWNTLVEVRNQPWLFSIEVCDAVEDDDDGYDIDGVRVSNFVYPDWFEPTSKATRLDHLRQCKYPLEIRPGGYMSVFRIGIDKQWIEVNGPKAKRLEIKKKYRSGYTRTAKRNNALKHQVSLSEDLNCFNGDPI